MQMILHNTPYQKPRKLFLKPAIAFREKKVRSNQKQSNLINPQNSAFCRTQFSIPSRQNFNRFLMVFVGSLNRKKNLYEN
jgi:hypothetical protein